MVAHTDSAAKIYIRLRSLLSNGLVKQIQGKTLMLTMTTTVIKKLKYKHKMLNFNIFLSLFYTVMYISLLKRKKYILK